jgi:hypothetical protein
MYFYPPIYHEFDDPQDGEVITYDAASGLWVNGQSSNGPSVSRVDALPRTSITTTQALGGGEMNFTYFTAPNAFTVSKIAVARSASGPNTTARYLALYSEDAATGNLTLVAETGNNAAILATPYTETALLANYTLVANQRYAIGILFNGATMPNLLATQTSVILTSGIDELLAAAPRISAQYVSTLTSPPASITASTDLTISRQAVMYLGVLA